jgi:hypothetical protein
MIVDGRNQCADCGMRFFSIYGYMVHRGPSSKKWAPPGPSCLSAREMQREGFVLEGDLWRKRT